MRLVFLVLLGACGGASVPPDSDPQPPKGAAAGDVAHGGLTVAEERRRELVESELAQGRDTVLLTDFTEASDEDRAFVGHMLHAGVLIERLFAMQTGADKVREQLPADHEPSVRLFERNQGPWCFGAVTEADPNCSAIPGSPRVVSGLYPSEIQEDPNFCARLMEQHPEVMAPFVAAVATEEGLMAVPYPERWPEEMAAIGAVLTAAARALDPDTEAALVAYLGAAAKAFSDNDWFAADVAWAEMNQQNSAWYLRIGPDETYFDPCAEHAGFHMGLARVNPAGLSLQRQLEPVKQQMEETLAAMAGGPYRVRQVGFDLPEFIDVIVNAGDSRAPLGATVGQSLPNWGPVSDAGGRTVAMTNVLVDADSIEAKARSMSSVFCSDTMALWPRDPEAQNFATVLHEAAHNLGPSGEYRVDGQTDNERFGGPMSATLEELKCEMSALYLVDWLNERGVPAPGGVTTVRMSNLGWSMGKIAEGLVDGTGKPKAYPQLASVQVGYLFEHGALRWQAETSAANGTDAGCFELDAQTLPVSIEALTTEVLRIKSTGDAEAAKALIGPYVSEGTEFARLRDIITQRFGREARPSIRYQVIVE